MFSADDFGVFGSLGVGRVGITLPMATDVTIAVPSRVVVLIGHSAAGKSAALSHLSLDRSQREMDVYCQQHRLPHTVDVLLQMAASLTHAKIIVASNDSAFLDVLANSRRDGRFAHFLFVYLRRPPEMVYSHLSLENTDGRHHQSIPFPDYNALYTTFHRFYERICDIEIHYLGSTISSLARIITLCLGNFVGEQIELPQEAASSSTLPVSSVDATTRESFSNYFELLQLAETSHRKFISLTTSEMSRLTAGGYQAFDSATFPPMPAPNSIAAVKYRDLRWEASEFVGKSTLELGSQLGFFSFSAAALGARECVGIDLNKTFVTEANKMAINYKKFICNWPDDRVKFVNTRISVGDRLPILADIILANSIVHWWIIQNSDLTIREVLTWLHSNCGYGVYFEGCVGASEDIMKRNAVSLDRYNEGLFISSCEEIFSEVKYIGRCTYNKERLVLRLLK